MKLSQKIILSFILVIVLSFLIVSLISENMINKKFNVYLVDEKENRIEQISKEINSLYQENEYVIYQKEINSYANLENINISVMNLKNEPMCVSNRSSSHGGGHGNMKSHGHMERNQRRDLARTIPTDDSKYTEQSFPLIKDGDIIGHILIGYIDESYLTENALVFKNTLRDSFKLSGIITILIGVGISIFLSYSLTNPLVKINDTALEISKGNLGKKTNIKTNTREIKELAGTIEKLGDSLSKQEEIRNKYASDISHELRTPITTIKGHLEAIIDGIWEPSDDHLNILIVEIDRLSSLVNDLNKSFKSKSYDTVLNKENFNLSNELNQIVRTFDPVFKKNGYILTTEIEEDIDISMDKNKLDQIMHNLLSNSLKHLDSDGRVTIKLDKIDGDKILLAVEDNGIGIKEKDLDFIFNRFYRADESRSTKTGGSGIGLSIVKSFVEKHKGSISMESEYGVGTRVNIILPRK